MLIDTPPTMSSLVQEALATADYYFIPSKPEFLAVEGVGQAMSFAKQTITEVPHTNPVFLGVVLNQVDTRRSSYQDFESELKQILADKLFKTHISQLTEIADSPFYAKTVLDFNENSKAIDLKKNKNLYLSQGKYYKIKTEIDKERNELIRKIRNIIINSKTNPSRAMKIKINGQPTNSSITPPIPGAKSGINAIPIAT